MPLQIPSRSWKALIATPQMQGVAALVLCLISAGLGSRLGSGVQGTAMSSGRREGNVNLADATLAVQRPVSEPAVQGEIYPVAGMSGGTVLMKTTAPPASSGAAPAVEDRGFSASQTSLPVRAPQAPAVRRAVEPRVLVPMIFQEVSPVAAGLSGAQVATISQMRSQFNDQVGSSTSATDPQYRARWVSAQIQADDLLRAYLGWEKFNQYQIQAAQASH